MLQKVTGCTSPSTVLGGNDAEREEIVCVHFCVPGKKKRFTAGGGTPECYLKRGKYNKWETSCEIIRKKPKFYKNKVKQPWKKKIIHKNKVIWICALKSWNFKRKTSCFFNSKMLFLAYKMFQQRQLNILCLVYFTVDLGKWDGRHSAQVYHWIRFFSVFCNSITLLSSNNIFIFKKCDFFFLNVWF